jgi:D-arginine dehydrogenase
MALRPTPAMTAVDFVVVGAGIAGLSVAYELANEARVIVLEREDQIGYHSTGRSAAVFSAIYGNPVIRALSRASRPFLASPPAGFTASGLLKQRGALTIATDAQEATLSALLARDDVSTHTRLLSSTEARQAVPILKQESSAHALLEPGASDIDVHSLHHGYLNGLRARGGQLVRGCYIASLSYVADRWLVCAAGQTFEAPTVVNAAGAWADEVAQLAGIRPLGLTPLRRTAALVDAPVANVESWPAVIAIDESYYFKPDAGKLLLSPADETPCPAGDVQADELDVALAVERIEQATTFSVSRVTHRWAGLRTFAADRIPVVGCEPDVPGFFWLAGQGGYGIQTAPALARVAAAVALNRPVSPELRAEGIAPDPLSPRRLRPATQ